MVILEQVMQMKQQGIPESQIIQFLREQGLSPREINESLSQSKIKSEVDAEGPIVETEFQKRPVSRAAESNEYTQAGMQPSIMPSESQPEQYPQENYQEYPYPQYQYPQPQEDYYYQPSDIETINGIAEQIVEEKTSELKKQIASLTKLRQEISPEIQRIEKRLEKVENTINELQMAVLRKIGEYGQDIKKISEEMQATQESFSKMINPVLDKQRGETSDETSEEEQEKKPRRKKSPANFEHYLR